MPTAISFSPSFGTGSRTLSTGTLVTTATVTISDGSAFAETLTAPPDNNGNQTLEVSGLQLKVLQPGWGNSFGIASGVQVSATQNGFSVQMPFNEDIS